MTRDCSARRFNDVSPRDRTASKCILQARLFIIIREDRRLPFQEENKIPRLASLLSSHVVAIVSALCHLWVCRERHYARGDKRERVFLQSIVTIIIIANQETIMLANDNCCGGNNDGDDDDNDDDNGRSLARKMKS